MSKKTFILTHPLTGNYGGLLQAYACYSVLNDMGCNPYIYRYIPDDFPMGTRHLLQHLLQHLKAHIKYLIGRSSNPNTVWRRLYISRKFLKSLRFYNETSPAPQDCNISYVVGSDQVWRPEYCRLMRNLGFYFLSFATLEQRKNSIAYAASIAIDNWNGTPEETEICKNLIKDFKAISVREHSGINICKNKLGREAVQMPDPTLLLQNSKYESIIHKAHTWSPDKPFLSAYILDLSANIRKTLQNCANTLGLHLQHLYPQANAIKRRDRFAVTVPQWLKLIRDCNFFITDSFHGCVFAIIFNKPFVCLGNESRGAARFDSLLSTFGLQSRLIVNHDNNTILKILNSPIDWEKVNAIRHSEQERAFDFLRTHLRHE